MPEIIPTPFSEGGLPQAELDENRRICAELDQEWEEMLVHMRAKDLQGYQKLVDAGVAEPINSVQS